MNSDPMQPFFRPQLLLLGVEQKQANAKIIQASHIFIYIYIKLYTAVSVHFACCIMFLYSVSLNKGKQ